MCRFLGRINERTGTAVLATAVSGVLSAGMSLFVGLAVLVELMSIGESAQLCAQLRPTRDVNI